MVMVMVMAMYANAPIEEWGNKIVHPPIGVFAFIFKVIVMVSVSVMVRVRVRVRVITDQRSTPPGPVARQRRVGRGESVQWAMPLLQDLCRVPGP